jgi:hypothetical protein
VAPRSPRLRGAVSVCGPAAGRDRALGARAWPASMVSIGAAGVIAFGLLVDELRAGSRDGGRDREVSRELSQQSGERSSPQSTQTEHEDGRSQDSFTSQQPKGDPSQQRSSTGDTGDRYGGQRGREGRSERGHDDDGPPKTVLDLIRRMTSPRHAGVGHATSAPELASHHVLAVGLSSSAMARARELGFTISHGSARGRGNGRVAQLVPPPGLDVVAASELLRSEFPGSQVGLNYAYHPYRNATGEGGQAAARAQGVRQATIGGCNPDRCYGPGVIGWQHDLGACAKGARIGIIDTSADLSHPALKGRNIELGDFLPKGATPVADSHGTGVLAILAGDPNSGTPGLVPDAHFFAANVYRADEGGQPVADTLSLLKAIDWLATSKVEVVNMSLSGPDDKLLQDAIAETSRTGVVFVAAAGNGGPAAPPSYPAAYANVVAVTAVDKDLRGYIYANHGEYIDIAAPGVNIWTALPNALEGYQSGTSFAAPHVTAILAAVQGRVRDKSKEGYLKVLSIRDLGPPGRDSIYGRGLALAPATCPHNLRPGGWITSVVESSSTVSTTVISRPAAYK